jgi:hypothetical protein
MPILPDADIPNGILFDDNGNVIHDAYAEATGLPAFKTRAEYEAANRKLEADIERRWKERAAKEAAEAAITASGTTSQ